MRKILITAFILLCGIAGRSQVYFPVYPTIYGQHSLRIKVDSALLVPSKDTLSINSSDSSAQIFYNKKDKYFYGFSLDKGFFKIGSGTDSSSYHTLGQAPDSSYFTIITPDGRVDTVRFVGGTSSGGGGITQSQLDDSTAAIRSNLRPYKVYTALLDNSAGDHTTITATVLENTIGAIVWTRNGIGDWVGTLSGAFTGNFAAFLGSDQIHAVGQAENLIKFDDNTVHFQVRDDDSAGGSIDGSIWSLPIEIRIYP